MATVVEIRISGLALFFCKNDVWNVILPCGGEHKAKLTGYGGLNVDLYEEGRQFEFSFDGTDFVRDAPYFNQDLAPSFNMSEVYAHGQMNGKSNLMIRDEFIVRKSKCDETTDPEEGSKRSFVWLKVPHAEMTVSSQTKSVYWCKEVTNDCETSKGPLTRMARAVTLSFSFENLLKLKVKEKEDVVLSKRYPGGTNIPLYEFGICNDCLGNTKHNDFGELYDFVFDIPTDGEREFLAGKYDYRGQEAQIKILKGEFDLELMNVHGNCDPVGSDPPPQP